MNDKHNPKFEYIDISKKKNSLNKLADDNNALLVMLNTLNDEDLEKVNKFISSLDSDPIFVARDQATCD